MNALSPYQWQYRILVVFEDPTTASSGEQSRRITAHQDAFEQRDLVAFVVTGSTVDVVPGL